MGRGYRSRDKMGLEGHVRHHPPSKKEHSVVGIVYSGFKHFLKDVMYCKPVEMIPKGQENKYTTKNILKW